MTQYTYDAYRRWIGRPRRPVRQITEAEVRDLYRRQYWTTIRGDDLPSGIDYVVFDAAVHSGPVQAVKWLQRALAMDQNDGIVGEATLAVSERWRRAGPLGGMMDARHRPSRAAAPLPRRSVGAPTIWQGGTRDDC